MIAVGSALWPVAQRASALEPGGPAGRCGDCPTPGVCEARGHDFKIRTYDAESPGRCADCPTPGVCEARGHDFKIRTYDVESPVSPGESS